MLKLKNLITVPQSGGVGECFDRRTFVNKTSILSPCQKNRKVKKKSTEEIRCFVKSPGIQDCKEGNGALEYHRCNVIVIHNT